ncbi:MAG: hypothetical protein HKP58_05045 [Desulfatitalea sp.]|nr:hypothetical protein [Desulfatitalea sp.]NNJ99759.1 hypothetical protein [Desulfatitalea sp.]
MQKRKTALATETLTGIVTPIQWDDSGRISEVALFATDDEEYVIENGEKFLDFAQKSIKATGPVKRNQKAFKSIHIKRFDILEDF